MVWNVVQALIESADTEFTMAGCEAHNETLLRFHGRWIISLYRPPSQHEKEKAAPLREQERLNGARKTLKGTMQGISEAFRAIDEQIRQVQGQRHRGNQCRRDEYER